MTKSLALILLLGATACRPTEPATSHGVAKPVEVERSQGEAVEAP